MAIPASAIASVTPGVISAGGAGLVLNGMVLTTNTRVPIGTVMSFVSPQAVSAFFGPSSQEYALSLNYFNGFNGSTQLPGLLYFYQYAQTAAVSAYIRGGSVSSLTIAQLQAVTGSLSVTIDGTVKTYASVNLSAASSFSAAAAALATGLSLSGGQTCTYDSVSGAFVITSGTTGSTSTMTYASGTAAASLGLTQAVGATLSQGAPISTPAAAMNAIIALTQNWAAFTSVFEPVTADKLSFASWTNSSNGRYAYIAWDSDTNASVQCNTSCFGYQLTQAAYNGTYAIGGDPSYASAQGTTLAALNAPIAFFNLGIVASINFSQKNGRVNFAGRSQSGLAYNVANQTIAVNLATNGYNFYGDYATANQSFILNNPGQVSGEFDFFDEYINQLWLNSNFQLALMNLFANALAVPYNNQGYSQIRQSLAGPINQGLYFGAFVPGVTLTPAQVAEVNGQAGLTISTALYNLGYYLQVLDPGGAARQVRKTPIINFWYTDGGSVQQFNMASIDVQ